MTIVMFGGDFGRVNAK